MKIRPQILSAIILLAVMSFICKEIDGVTIGCMAGIIALAKDIMEKE